MPDTDSITINKQFTYRGQAEIFSNTYHLEGTTPTTDAEWNTLALAIWASEAPAMVSTVKYCGYLGYEAGNEYAVSIKDYIADGIALPAATHNGSGIVPPGDAAVWVRWATPDRTSRGKRIYLRKYFHGVNMDAGDLVTATAKTALLAHGAKMTSGTLPGGMKICGPQGADAGAVLVSPYITTRTLKRRGKRPSS